MQRAEMLHDYELNGFTPTKLYAERFDVDPRTIRRHLHSMNMHHRVPASKVDMTENHKIARENFANRFRNFDWTSTIFTDEKTFQSSEHGRLHLWRYNSTRYDIDHVIPNRQSGRICVNMWGWMSSEGVGELVELPPRANSLNYINILEEVMLPSVRNVYPEHEMPNINFVHDNCSIHRARIVTAWLNAHPAITVIPWPAKSPDLNPIENLWGLMVQRWDHRNERRKDVLAQHCQDVWESMRGTNIGARLVASMRTRLQAVSDSHGAYTKY